VKFKHTTRRFATQERLDTVPTGTRPLRRYNGVQSSKHPGGNVQHENSGLLDAHLRATFKVQNSWTQKRKKGSNSAVRVGGGGFSHTRTGDEKGKTRDYVQSGFRSKRKKGPSSSVLLWGPRWLKRDPVFKCQGGGLHKMLETRVPPVGGPGSTTVRQFIVY